MSLHQTTSGLLGTHVNWEDIEDEIRQSLGTNARFGDNKQATNIGNMKGFTSKTALIEPDWTQDSEMLPKKFVVKISSLLAICEISKVLKHGGENGFSEEKLESFYKITKDLHNREVEAYEFLSNIPEIPLLKIYSSRKFSAENPLKAFIILEYVENVKHVPIYESLEPLEIIEIVQNIAKFSSVAEIFPKNELKFATEPEFWEKILREFGDEKVSETIFLMLRQDFPEEYEDKVEELIDIYRFLMSPEYLAKLHEVSKFLGFPLVLIHGDLCIDNLLFLDEGYSPRIMQLYAIIDWQTVSFGSPAQDLCRLFLSILTAKNRRENLDYLLEIYYRAFLENLENFGLDKKIPFTFEQLKSNYQLLFPLLTIMVLPGILRFTSFVHCSQEETMKIRDLAIEKSVGMMEDAIEIHRKNLIEFSDFYKL
ncbi:unnamed protein product [Caenorhabditis angaria]|uniref:CHK kinase-like domain-containing protein n=1 Tax=Caenorhabditis angaria TaxID=860376 RepID=A0A9P1IQD9_9PELO|nr:unnamed protein product [Caenorhabditis angaria]